MNVVTKTLIALCAVAVLGACDDKPKEVPQPATNGVAVEAPVEQVVKVAIPAEMKAAAEAEITEENADEMAAQLEKEIDAEMQ